MLTVQNYLDLALEKNRFWSDRELSRALDLSAATVNAWRTGRSLPTDEPMLQLAKLAGVTPEQALLELSYWRASGDAKKTYEGLLKKVSGALAVFLCVFSINVNANAGTIQAQYTSKLTELYIIKLTNTKISGLKPSNLHPVLLAVSRLPVHSGL